MTYADFAQKPNGNSVSSRHLNPKLTLLRPLDYENVDDREIYATFFAIDGGDPPLTGSLSIIVRLLDINDNSPIFAQYSEVESLISLPENTTLNYKPFITVNATDADSGDNGRITYSFSPLANNLVLSKFNIDSRTGAITIREPLDYEVYSERNFVLPIVAKDSGSPQHSSTTSIYVQIKDVNDNVPTLVVQENITIPEGQVFTKPVLRFYVRDEDEVSHGNIICKPVPLDANNYIHDKELVAGQDYLRLHPVSDTVFFVFTKGVLDYEKIPRASLLIECLDSAEVKQQNSTSKSQQKHQLLQLKSHRIRITAAIRDQNDNMPVFTQTKYYVKIPEHVHEGSLVTEVRAHDLDSGEYGQLTYQLGPVAKPSGVLIDTPNSNNIVNMRLKQPFQIEPTTGIIKVLHNDMLDREQTEFLYIPIIAKDKGGLTATAQLIIELIDINDNPPKLVSSQDLKVEENQKINTIIGSIHLIDLDKGKNSRIHLLITNQHNKLNEMIKYVKIVPDFNFNYSQSTPNELINNGDIKALLVSQIPLDREKTATIFYEIVSYDEGQSAHSVTHTITIHVTDQNDNIPMCTYPIFDSIIGYHPIIYTNTPVHSLVIQVRGYDPDQGLNGTILYHLDKSTNGSEYFYLNQSTGELFTNWLSNLNSHQPSEYTNNHQNIKTNPNVIEPHEGIYQIKILLTDMGIPALSKETQFFVKINPLNPNLNKWNTVETTVMHQPNKSIPLNSNFKLLLNNRFVIISLILFIILLIITIMGIAFWTRSHRKQKICHSIKSMISDQNECNPIIMPTTIEKNNEHQNKEILPILTYDGRTDKSPVVQHQNLHILTTHNENEQKLDGIISNMLSTPNFKTVNHVGSLWPPDSSTLDQYTDKNEKTLDRHSTYSHFSVNSDHHNSSYIHPNPGFSSQLQTNPLFSFPFGYDTSKSLISDSQQQQSTSQKLSSLVYSPNAYYSMSTNPLYTQNTIVSNAEIMKYNNNLNWNGGNYLSPPEQKSLQYSIVYPGHHYPHSSLDRSEQDYYNQSQSRNENMKFW
ncbi:unnamed protein product [Heterobilharzia americana]|nr:unnamed protein product [Heterobilharzia americana]